MFPRPSACSRVGGQLVLVQDRGQCDQNLVLGELTADACSGANPERTVDVSGQFAAILRQESIGVELVRIGPHDGCRWAASRFTNTQSFSLKLYLPSPIVVSCFACRKYPGATGQSRNVSSTTRRRYRSLAIWSKAKAGNARAGQLASTSARALRGDIRVGGQEVQRECDCVGRGFASGHQEGEDLVSDVVVV